MIKVSAGCNSDSPQSPVKMASPGASKAGSWSPGITGTRPSGTDYPSYRPTSRDTSGHARLDNLRVLVVDDNRDAADSLGMLLRLLGAEVRAVYESPTAQAEFESFKPALVLLDIGMPIMDGYEVARRIRARLKVGDATRLIAVTGWGKEDTRHLALMAGFDDLLLKPVAMKDLERVIWSLGL